MKTTAEPTAAEQAAYYAAMAQREALYQTSINRTLPRAVRNAARVAYKADIEAAWHRIRDAA